MRIKDELMAGFLLILIGIQGYSLYAIHTLEHKPDLSKLIQHWVQKEGEGIVQIVLPGVGMCSGAVIDPRGYILSANHCTSDVSTPVFDVIFTSKNQPFKAKVVWQDKSKDLLLLKLLEVPTDLVVIPIAQDNPAPGSIVWKIGYGLGYRSIAMGLMTDIITIPELKAGPMYIQHDVLQKPGDSGSPLLNLEGQIIGINDKGLQESPFLFSNLGLNYSIEVKTIHEFLHNAEAVIPPSPEVVKCSSN